MRVEVVIDRLVLRGVEVRSHRRLIAALREELTGRLDRDGLPARMRTAGRHEHLRSTPVRLSRGPGRDAALGRELGRQVYASLAAGGEGAPGRAGD